MTSGVAAVCWPAARLGEALELLAPRVTRGRAPVPPDEAARLGGIALGDWLERAADALGLEVRPAATSFGAVADLAARFERAVVHVPGRGFLVIVGRERRALVVAAPDRARRRVPIEEVVRALREPLEAPVVAAVERAIRATGLVAESAAAARTALLARRLRSEPIEGCWTVRAGAETGFWQRLCTVGFPRLARLLAAVYLAQYLFWLLSWALIGRAALEGRVDRGWLVAWALSLLTLVFLRPWGTWLQGAVAIAFGGQLRGQLLRGAMRLDPEDVRHEGTGRLLGRVVETEAIESLATSGGLFALVAVIELALAAGVLALGASGALHVAVLAATLALAAAGARGHWLRRRAWTDARLRMTNDLVERMLGHRTRAVQEAAAERHTEEDAQLADYLARSEVLDSRLARWVAWLPRGWLCAGLAALVPAFVGGASQAALAVSVGGILLAFQALERLVESANELAGAAIAWREIAPFERAARLPRVLGATSPAAAAGERGAVLEAHDLVFRHGSRAVPVLHGASLRLGRGERMLVEGASGSGKSTLAALLTGARAPNSGLLLLDGLDVWTLGTRRWRERVAAAPQFHENHVFAATFAFNLLLGRRWPPWPEDLAVAVEICGELGLGELLERMPAGMMQMVGDTGWRLSHGERSRLFIARALLQRADVLVLDESLAALDAENLQRSLRCVVARAPSLFVIAHP